MCACDRSQLVPLAGRRGDRVSDARGLDEVRAYWEAAAAVERDGDGLKPTARDPNLQAVVEASIEKWIAPGSSVLDVGCGDGASTIRFARRAGRIVGVDYIPRFVDRARAAADRAEVRNASFLVGNVLGLESVWSDHGRFDVAITIRCLINLASLENQVRAISQIASCVRPGGLLLTSEGWQEGRDGLNRRRVESGLPAMDLVDHNLLITRRDFEEAVASHFDIVTYESAGLYLFVSRIVQPLYVAPDEPSVDHPLNAMGARLQTQANDAGLRDFDDCDYSGVYVLRRRES
jgi:SAM-dependent methyltransferase